MDAALQLIADHGVGGTSLQMIADAVGVTKAAVYHQFKTKEQIVIALTERELGCLEEALRPPRPRITRRGHASCWTESSIWPSNAAGRPAPCSSIPSSSGCSVTKNRSNGLSSVSTVCSPATPATTARCWRR